METKDFREAVQDEIRRVIRDGVDSYEATTRILALCKEMLVPEKEGSGGEGFAYEYEGGWNACRQHLLKQLGE